MISSVIKKSILKLTNNILKLYQHHPGDHYGWWVIIGASIACYLAKKDCKDIVVLEKDYVGSGSPERAGSSKSSYTDSLYRG
jgi:hypothetical protein